MSTIDTSSDIHRTTPEPSTDGWRTLMRGGAVAVALTALLMQFGGRFFGPSFAILAIACLVAAWLPTRRRRAAAWVIVGFNLASLALHGGMAVAGLLHPEVLLAAVLGVANAVASILALIGAVAILRRVPPTSAVPARSALVAAALLAAFTVVSVAAYATRASVVPSAGEAVLVHEGLAVSPTEVAVDTGSPTLVVRNTDPLYPRGFDIDALDVHVMIPPRTAVRIELPAEPATYDFSDGLTMTSATSGTVTVD